MSSRRVPLLVLLAVGLGVRRWAGWQHLQLL